MLDITRASVRGVCIFVAYKRRVELAEKHRFSDVSRSKHNKLNPTVLKWFSSRYVKTIFELIAVIAMLNWVWLLQALVFACLIATIYADGYGKMEYMQGGMKGYGGGPTYGQGSAGGYGGYGGYHTGASPYGMSYGGRRTYGPQGATYGKQSYHAGNCSFILLSFVT